MIYYIKTKNINVDRRAHKEWYSLSRHGETINLVYSSDVEIESRPELSSIAKIDVLGGAAPSNTILRLLGAFVFSVFSFFKSFFIKGDRKHWVNDPVLFLLVVLLCFFRRGFIVWDHHELPPDWLMNHAAFRFVFRIAYKSADAVIHTNNERRQFLEEKLSYVHNNSLVVGNFPLKSEMQQVVPVSLRKTSLNDYIYLQNCVGESRCDLEIFKAVKASGLKAVHAGSCDPNRITRLVSKLGDLDFCEFVGVRNIAEINYLLRNSICTLVFYKNISANNWFCEPNRLYQAAAQGCVIIGGNNPPIAKFLGQYRKGVFCSSDGADSKAILDAISESQSLNFDVSKDHKIEPYFFWDDYEAVFESIARI